MFEERTLWGIPTLETRYESNEKVDRHKRYTQIIEILKNGGKMTAKQIAVEMYNKGYIPTTERNFSAPRVTELMQKGIVEQIGKQKCEYTGKTVAVFCLREE